MISLISIFRRLWKVMRTGWSDEEFRGLSILLGGWLALGTVVYSIYEGWTIIESLYFSVMTLTTIGYGDYTPSGPIMQLYTVFYAVLGIGMFVAFNARLVSFAMQGRKTSLVSDESSTDKPE